MENSPIVASFEAAKKTTAKGSEYWTARDLQPHLGYAKWDNFSEVIGKAITACEKSGASPDNHFLRTGKMMELGKGAQREGEDYFLSRYACYLIAMNGSSRVPAIAAAQSYFAIQTQKQEKHEEEAKRLSEDERRLNIRGQVSEHNKKLASAAREAGVETPFDYAIFQDEGYKGLYGGLGNKEIHKKKGLKKSQKILDHMDSTELAANLFRATQTEEQLKKTGVKGKVAANHTHREVGKKVRQAIRDIGGTMPEEIPAAPSIKKIEIGLRKKIEPQAESAGAEDDVE